MMHTFAICAYQESPYLERAIQSVLNQAVSTKVILCTSTPNEYIEKLAEKYHIPVYVREGKSDIQDDWNFAYQMADTEYVTIAHQDDIYRENYTKELLDAFQKYPDTILAMTDYKIINQEDAVRGDVSLLIKQILKLPLRIPFLANKRWVKLRVQSLGNAICCPSVCYHKSLIQKQRTEEVFAKTDSAHREAYKKEKGADAPLFQSNMKYALDWDGFYALAHLKGRFTYVAKELFYYRMHDGTTTQKCLKNNQKSEEEIQMFRKFWPKWVVRMIMKAYKLSYRSYE